MLGDGGDGPEDEEGFGEGAGEAVGVDDEEAVRAGGGEEGGDEPAQSFGAPVPVADDHRAVDGLAPDAVGTAEGAEPYVLAFDCLALELGEHEEPLTGADAVEEVCLEELAGVLAGRVYDDGGTVVAVTSVALERGYDGALGGGECPAEPALEVVVPRG